MPNWGEILKELNSTIPRSANGEPVGGADFDLVRRGYLGQLHRHTRRNVVLFASGWLQKEAPPDSFSISDEDVQALMEVTSHFSGRKIDLILHSPGGSLEATEGIVAYLRSRFDDIRVIVPHLAMSAATMVACAANEILMGKHSFLGPIDPQLILSTKLGKRYVAAQAILDQFDKATKACSEPSNLPAWLPMLSQYGPDLLVQSEMSLELARELVGTWLETYMFSGRQDGPDLASSISDWLSNHTEFKSHSRHLSRESLQGAGLVVHPLERDPMLQDLSLSVFHATTHTFSGTLALKIFENHLGRAFIKKMPPPPPPLQIGIDRPTQIPPPSN